MFPNLFPSVVGRTKWTPFSEPTLTFLADWNSTAYKEIARTNLSTADGDAVASWTDQVGGRNVQCISEPEAPKLIATAGPGGHRALQFDSGLATPTGPLYFATGSQILNNQPFTMAVIYQNVNIGGYDDGLVGRGGNANAGTLIKIDAGDRSAFQFNASSTVNSFGIDNGVDPPLWRVAACSYDGAQSRRCVKALTSPFTITGNTALTGALSFNAADTAFWIGGVTQDGVTFTWCNTKKIALVMVMTRVPGSNPELQDFVRNLMRYTGIVP